MQFLDSTAVAEALPYNALIDALDDGFRQHFESPPRAHHSVSVPDSDDATLLLMPAWQSGESLGIKIATVFPDNARRSLPAVYASYLLLDAQTGMPIAFLDGTELTLRRTAAASALASRYLSRTDAQTMLMVGTGKLAPHLIRAHATVRNLKRVVVWGRRPSEAERVAKSLKEHSVQIDTTNDLESAVAAADILSCATLAASPLILGKWLVPGQHLDLVGAFTPDMAEVDAEAVACAEVFVDTREGASSEAGDILQAVQCGKFDLNDVCAELAELASGQVVGRQSAKSITLFKSVGAALEDLVAATLAVHRHTSDRQTR